MKITVRIKIAGLKRKIGKAKAEIPTAAEQALRELAEEAIDLIEHSDEGDRRAFLQRAIDRQLASVFVPVTLKHKRVERWPDLAAIYQARIIRHQRTWQGPLDRAPRKRFYVDRSKEDALAAELLRRALARNATGSYEVRFLATSDRRYRVEIIKRRGGVISRRDREVMIAYAKQRMRVLAPQALRHALSRAGLR